jgi:hypothetical protein
MNLIEALIYKLEKLKNAKLSKAENLILGAADDLVMRILHNHHTENKEA